MIVIDSLRDFMRGLDKRQFRIYVGLYIAMCATIVMGIVIRHVYLLREAKGKIKQLNQTRGNVQKVLTDFGQVVQQRTKIDALLAQRKNFHIQKFLQDTVQNLGMSTENKDKLSSQKLENGYIEESLSVSLSKITTKQLCELLKEIENEELLYIKFIDIEKQPVMKKIKVTMDIATLRSKSE